jgi:tricarballylate dehydrogenase
VRVSADQGHAAEKATEREAGGNTRWSPSYMHGDTRPHRNDIRARHAYTKLKATKLILRACQGCSTVKGLSHGIELIQPTYYLAKPPRIQPSGGGLSS